MKSKFFCKECNNIFEGEAKKQEYTDPVYGPCTKYYSYCPECNSECSEYYKPKPSKSKSDEYIPPCGNPNMNCCRV